jgi:hypothetical protein
LIFDQWLNPAPDLPYRVVDDIPLRDEDIAAFERCADLFVAKHAKEKKDGVPVDEDNNWGWTLSLVHGTLTIDERAHQNLHPDLRTGLFREPGSYAVLIRFNCTDGGAVRLSMRVNTPDAMGLPVLTECSPSSVADHKQIDLLFTENFREFFTPTIDDISTALSLLLAPSLSSVLRAPRALFHLLNNRNRYTREGLQPSIGPCGKAYYAALPFKLGPSAMKIGLLPRQAHPRAGEDVPSKAEGDEREATRKNTESLVDFLATQAASWDFAVQVATHKSHRIDSGSARWDERQSPFVPVGTLTLPRQSSDDASESTLHHDSLQFNPWNMLEAHRPLGAMQRARYIIYQRHSAERFTSRGIQPTTCPFKHLPPED